MPVILTAGDEVERWLSAETGEALEMQRPLMDGMLSIVAKGKEGPQGERGELMRAIATIFYMASSIGTMLCLPSAAAAQSPTISSYEHLKLDTPDSALREFLGAYRKGDFVVAFWILSPNAQMAWIKDLTTFNLNRFLKGKIDFQDKEVMDALPGLNTDQTDYSFMFAAFMQFAHRRGIQPLDVTGLPTDMSIDNVPDLGKRTQRTDGLVDYAVTLKAYNSPVIFRMQISPIGRWRMQQIIPAGGDEKTIPFGMPSPASK